MAKNHQAVCFHEDDGHGWLQVPLSEVEALGIAGSISRCSYASNGFVYLEEDCDMSLYIEALLRKGLLPGWDRSAAVSNFFQGIPAKYHRGQAPLRNYGEYRADDSCTCPLVWNGTAQEPKPDPQRPDPVCPVHGGDA